MLDSVWAIVVQYESNAFEICIRYSYGRRDAGLSHATYNLNKPSSPAFSCAIPVFYLLIPFQLPYHARIHSYQEHTVCSIWSPELLKHTIEIIHFHPTCMYGHYYLNRIDISKWQRGSLMLWINDITIHGNTLLTEEITSCFSKPKWRFTSNESTLWRRALGIPFFIR